MYTFYVSIPDIILWLIPVVEWPIFRLIVYRSSGRSVGGWKCIEVIFTLTHIWQSEHSA